MELWIRSQDKTRLGKIELIEYQEDAYGFYLFGWRDKFEGTRLATYKTKERALEVLDEINEILQLKLCTTLGTFEEIFKGYTEKQLRLVLKQMAVYEMPEE